MPFSKQAVAGGNIGAAAAYRINRVLLLRSLSALVQLKRSASHHTAVCSAVQAIEASKEQAAMLHV